MNDVVLYLNSSTRALVAISAPGVPLDPALVAGTVQVQISGQRWQSYLATRDSLPVGQDLSVNDDGSTGQVAHVASPREQAYAILAAYLANASPTGAETVQALKTLIRVVRALVQ